jgi:hypothetical protein
LETLGETLKKRWQNTDKTTVWPGTAYTWAVTVIGGQKI